MKIEDGRYGMKVRCLKGSASVDMHEGEVFKIAVVVKSGEDWLREASGFILANTGGSVPAGYGNGTPYPYVWSADRFEPVEED